jgi:hypothetical protein
MDSITPTQYAAGFLAFAFIVIGLLAWACHKAPEAPPDEFFFSDSDIDEAYADTIPADFADTRPPR